MRPTSLRTSLAQRTALAMAAHTSHCARLGGPVPNAVYQSRQVHDQHLQHEQEPDRAPQDRIDEQVVERTGPL